MENLISFTKRITGITNLIDYVINYVDQHMILYSLMHDSQSYEINANKNDNTYITYDITGLTDGDMNKIYNLPDEQQVEAYGKIYTIKIDKSNRDKLIVMII